MADTESDEASEGPAEDVAEAEDTRASPTVIANPALRFEAKRAMVWVFVVGLVILAIYISRALLVIFGAMVFASLLDGGERLVGKALKIGRGWRLGIVLALTVAFFVWLGQFAGSQISREAALLPDIVALQSDRVIAWLDSQGFAIDPGDVQGITGQLLSGVGLVTRAIGGVFGAVSTLFLIAVMGIYVALEPRLYERGVAWMLSPEQREHFYITTTRMGATMRRLMAGRLVGMLFEGAFTWVMLWVYGVPMAALLGILTGLLAFIPNLGALIAGGLMVLVGFSGGTDMGLYTILVYFLVQTFDGWVVIPLIAKKTVDLAPALVLAAQLIMGLLFGVLGLFLADPLLAMLKVALERRAEESAKDEERFHAA